MTQEIISNVVAFLTKGAHTLEVLHRVHPSALLMMHTCHKLWGVSSKKKSTTGNTKEGPYQHPPLLYAFNHNPSLLGSCSSPGSACSCPIRHIFPQKIERNGLLHTRLLQYPTPKYNPNPIHTVGFLSVRRSSRGAHGDTGVGHVQELHQKGSPEIGI